MIGPPNTQTVLSDLLDWLAGDADSALANLMNWQHLDLQWMSERVRTDRNAKPRIEISASIIRLRDAR